jgi:hypothetical protein
MFGKKMTVEARGVRVFASPSTARIVFVQRWSSGNFADVGPKHIVLRHGPGGYRIVREVVFASDTRKPGAIDVVAFRQFAFVMDNEVVVNMHPDEAWATGPAEIARSKADQFLIRAKRRVDTKKLPRAVKRPAPRRVRAPVRCHAAGLATRPRRRACCAACRSRPGGIWSRAQSTRVRRGEVTGTGPTHARSGLGTLA